MSFTTEHLYIHWPFCKNKCWYCDFTSFAKREQHITAYHNALCNEIREFGRNAEHKNVIKTVFFGGGTPSLYPLDLLKELFEVLDHYFSLDSLLEATIEVNPGTVTKEHLETWRDLKIDRLSIGVQMLDETILQRVNRHQSNQDVIDLLNTAPRYFDNISADLILGLPGTTTKTWFKTLDYVTSQQITHCSVYFLTVYKNTPLFKKIQNKEITLPASDWFIKTYKDTIEFLERHGLFQYEISNFARENFASIHNLAYWDRKPYKGFGLSAASFDGKKRLVNSHNLVEYIDCPSGGASQETLMPQNVFLEELMLGLRQKKGVNLQRMLYFLEGEQKTIFEKKVEHLKKEGLIEEKNGKIFLTIRGIVLENEIVLNLL